MPASVYIPPPLASEARLNIQDQTATSAVDSGAAQDDSSLCTVDGLVRRRARLHPNSHAISYPSSGISYVDYTMQQLDVFAWRVAKHYEAHLPPRTSSAEKPAVVAMLGPSNLEYLITKMALSKLGHTILLLSTRIPQAAIENLINVTDAKTLLIDAKFEQMGTAIQEGMQNVKQMSIAPRSVFEFPIDVVGDTQLDGHLDPEVEKDNIIFIIHSSGSTGLPKPICQTQKSCIANYSSSMNMKAFVTLPLYHNHGICNLYRAIYAIKPLHMYNADLPLTQGHLIETMRQNQFEVFYGVPYALKLLSETEQGIRILQDLKIVMYGGSALSDDLGNLLVEKGVNLIGHYGATEVGQLMTSFRPQGDKAWNYVREHEKLIPYLRWVPRGPNLYECTVAEGWPAKVQSNQPDGSYATKDLFEPHPSIPRAWKYIARLDDTLVLLNGEKFGPVGMEGTIRSNKNVTEACVFGAGRPYLGLLVVPASHLKDKTDEEVADAIWPAVEAANEKADAFARISKSMIRVLPADCPYPRTDKGSIIRQAFYKAFEKEIDETYDAQDLGSDDLQAMDVPELRVFLHKLLLDTLASNVTAATSTSGVSDETDFFALGMDSLQAIQMRSQILKNVDVGGHKLGQNVVFDHPSIEKLAAFLHALRTGLNEAKDTTIESEMQSLISKYSDVPVQPSSVALTGATGSLGAHVAAVLAVKPEIGSIYCLVRATDAASARRRVKDSMIQRKVYHSLPLEARRKIIALPSDLSDPRLGLADGTYETVLQSLRTVIHCAWSVNFNMRLSSFEQSNIAGVRNLLSLCRSSRNGATMNFCSSVSTCTRATVSPVPESLPELEWAQGMGYAQSKSVAEHICARAAEQGITARVLRVGQIVADSRHGLWNAQEAVPMMMQTAVTIGALPKLTETPSWLPVDITAEAISDISLSDAGSVFANVAHPKSFNFINDLLPALRKTGLDFEEVAPKEWIRRLRDSNVDPKVNPPIKLVDFFASKYDKEDSEFGPSKKFSTSVACSLSPALANAPGLSQTQVDRFISYFLKSSWRPKASEDTKTAIIMAGPCGTGKSTAGAAIAQWLGVPFIEGDNLHKQDAVAKMRSATPLSDEDRRSWLMRVSSHGREALTELGYPSVVISCSALKRSYRDTIRTSLADDSNIRTAFIDLQADKDLLSQRLQDRRGHYMTSAMVQGQLEIHEVAGAEEDDVLPVDAEGDVETVIAEAKYLLAGLGLKGLNADI